MFSDSARSYFLRLSQPCDDLTGTFFIFSFRATRNLLPHQLHDRVHRQEYDAEYHEVNMCKELGKPSSYIPNSGYSMRQLQFTESKLLRRAFLRGFLDVVEAAKLQVRCYFLFFLPLLIAIILSYFYFVAALKRPKTQGLHCRLNRFTTHRQTTRETFS